MSIPIDLVVGARPNLMKMAPVLRALLARKGRFAPRVVHTGQHYDDVLAWPLGRPPAAGVPIVALGVGSQPSAAQTGAIIARYQQLTREHGRPAGMVVFGDVNSTLAAALAADRLKIPLAHVEAGLRSFDLTMPEEVNRIAADALAEILLVTEASAEKNLAREGRSPDAVHFVGNTMVDTLVGELAAARALGTAASLGLNKREYVYLTLHRPRNVDVVGTLLAYVDMLASLCQRVQVVFPVHPRTRAALEAAGQWQRLAEMPGLHRLEPQPYRAGLSLLADARLVMTDSGGIQDEAAYLGLPCLTLHTTTERPVTLEYGSNRLLRRAPEGALEAADTMLADTMPRPRAIPTWDGRAGERIAEVLLQAWG